MSKIMGFRGVILSRIQSFYTVHAETILSVILVTPGNPQRCNSVIAKRSIQLYFYVGLFTLGVLALINTVFENCQK